MIRLLRYWVLLCAVLLSGMQTASAVHNTAFGDEPHEHNGLVCDIGLIAPDITPDLPVPPVLAQKPQPILTLENDAAPAAAPFWAAPPGRAPPGRSPPL